MTSRTERFERKAKEVPRSGSKPDEEEEEILRFSPEEEVVRLISLLKWSFVAKLMSCPSRLS
jgi:hypothetical protein